MIENDSWLDRQDSCLRIQKELRWGLAKESVSDPVGGVCVAGNYPTDDRSAGVVLRNAHRDRLKSRRKLVDIGNLDRNDFLKKQRGTSVVRRANLKRNSACGLEVKAR